MWGDVGLKQWQLSYKWDKPGIWNLRTRDFFTTCEMIPKKDDPWWSSTPSERRTWRVWRRGSWWPVRRRQNISGTKRPFWKQQIYIEIFAVTARLTACLQTRCFRMEHEVFYKVENPGEHGVFTIFCNLLVMVSFWDWAFQVVFPSLHVGQLTSQIHPSSAQHPNIGRHECWV